MKLKISKYEYAGNSYSELLKNIFNGEPKMSWENEKISDIRIEIQREIVDMEFDADDPAGVIDYDSVLASENCAKEIWETLSYWHSEFNHVAEALPLKQWFKITYEDEFGELNTEFILNVNEEQAERECVINVRENDCDGYKCKNFKIVPLTSREEKKLAEQDEIDKFMRDSCTKSEAIAYIKAGSISILAADWNEWAAENDYCDEDGQPVTLDQIRNSKGDGAAIINAADGGEYVLLYVL